MHRHTPLHLQTHPSTKVRPADVFLRWWNVFLIFISGFGSQSWHLVTVMEQSISDRVYKGIKGREGEGVEAKWPISWGERFISLPGYGKRKGGRKREEEEDEQAWRSFYYGSPEQRPVPIVTDRHRNCLWCALWGSRAHCGARPSDYVKNVSRFAVQPSIQWSLMHTRTGMLT